MGEAGPAGSAGQGVEGVQRGFGVSVHSACDPGRSLAACAHTGHAGPAGDAPVGRGWDKGFRVRSARGHLGPVQTDAVSLTSVVNVLNMRQAAQRVSPQQREMLVSSALPPGPGGHGSASEGCDGAHHGEGRETGGVGENSSRAEVQSTSPSTRAAQLSPQLPSKLPPVNALNLYRT